jgi:hypothetical protein
MSSRDSVLTRKRLVFICHISEVVQYADKVVHDTGIILHDTGIASIRS